MGHHVWADVVPFVIHRIFEGSVFGGEKYDTDTLLLTVPEEWALGEFEEDEKEYERLEANPRQEVTAHGWFLAIFTNHPEYDGSNIGKNDRIYGYVWKKDDFVVHVVNESHYSNCGEYEVSICANDRASIEQFKDDFGLEGRIEENDSVTQSG